MQLANFLVPIAACVYVLVRELNPALKGHMSGQVTVLSKS
jgi:hypothetical protein